jgi:predicted Zn-dependent protease
VAAGLRRLEDALIRDPGSLALNLRFAETALSARKPDAAHDRLKRFLGYRDDEPRVFKLLSQAAGEMGREGLGHEYLAEYYYLEGELKRAELQLEIALKRPEMNFYDSSRLESRLAEVRAELDEEDRKRSAKP